MSKKRVHELAKELGIDSKDIIARMEKLGIAVKSHSSTLEEEEVARILREVQSKEPPGVVEQRITSGVIRRRTVRAAVEETPPPPPPPPRKEPEPPPRKEPEPPSAQVFTEPETPLAEPPPEPVADRTDQSAPAVPDVIDEPIVAAVEALTPAKPSEEPPPDEPAPVDIPIPIIVKADLPVPLETDATTDATTETAVSIATRPPSRISDKPVKPLRKPGSIQQTSGRKLLPEERRKLEGPRLIIPPKEIRPERPPQEATLKTPVAEKPAGPPPRIPGPPPRATGAPPRATGAPDLRPRNQSAGATARREERPAPTSPPPAFPKREMRPPAPPSKAFTPPPEKTRKEEPERFRGKVKKQAETAPGDPLLAKNKLAAAKLYDLRESTDDSDLPERVPKWRDERKVPTAKAMKKTQITVPKAIKRRIRVAEAITVGELAKKMGVKAGEVIGKLLAMGLMVTINQPIDRDTATIVATDFSFQVEAAGDDLDDLALVKTEPVTANLRPRAPVVTVMGHVDHGKTSLLDAIRRTNVIDGEAGGITQAIGAYHVQIKGRDIVFLDTPGHEAFTAMRARGARVTDIVVLVVAADDGVKEQTIEAINHARVASVPILVAVNKIDKPGADPSKIKQTLTEYNLLAEEWGGETIFCEVSAKKKEGIEELLEMILLQADIMNLTADPALPARGVIIEARLDRGRGPVSTVLIQEGTLREGDVFVSRTEFGRVRLLNNDQGRRVKEAGPSMPVEVIGFSAVPQVGSEFVVMEDDKKARAIADSRLRKEREKDLASSAKITLEQLYEKIREGVQDFNVIIKGDVQGSVEALSESLRKLSDSEVKLRIIHASTGAVTETDVMLASAANAVIIGFNVRPDGRVADLAQTEGIEIKLYDIIYNAIADVKAAMDGSLQPIFKEVVHGRVEIRDIFKVPKIGTIAGCFVNDGKVARSHRVKLIRDGVVVYTGRIHSLRRFKDDVKEVLAGFECGLSIEGFNDIKVGDAIESFLEEQVERAPK